MLCLTHDFQLNDCPEAAHSVESALWIWLFSQAAALRNPSWMMGNKQTTIVQEKQCPPPEGCVAKLG